MIDFGFKKLAIFTLCVLMAMSCQQKNKEIDKVKIVNDYIDALNASDYDKVAGLFRDSIRLREMDYVSAFSKEGYHSLFQWDSTFHPKYEILDVKSDGNEVRMKVSKQCERILFLNEEPIITQEVVKFDGDAIQSIDIVEYVVFNDSLWSAKRADLMAWIENHHPELNGFIYDQTKQGALNYLKAMALYKNRQDSIPVQGVIN
ncbi:hypothetical protein SAMN04487891_103144 [Flagellimonas taeanensis]|uniref:SnoaL-like domain-containing protein n=1 Tax=Flagellimonas taeanensis TaxID=1005926 RepID=A0A1M6TBY3_9FLAO|nr:nuclear transport factor 2 family protein [Allomuricauda taeanensis]SFB87024.1 hypothetical protein SAMN04487891_103144 [Allomuricauda taeanensis]SHK54384.1 hypothetical protein SAMN05216293_1306 [Allomuricauda taeanensis]